MLEYWINKLKDRTMELTQFEQQRHNGLEHFKKEDLWDNSKDTPFIYQLWKEGKNGIKTIFEEIMMVNFVNLAEDTNLWIQQITPSRINPNKYTPKHITIKNLKTSV